MKTKLNGVQYNTEIAVKVGTSNRHPDHKYNYVKEGLHMTPVSKTFFLAGEGGSMSKYSGPTKNSTRIAGSKIIPLTNNQAYSWAKDYLKPDAIEQYFGHLIVK